MIFESLAELGEYRARHDREKNFLSSPERGVGITYGQFYGLAKNFAQYLQENGLQKGQRVAIVLENGLEWAVSCWGVLFAGGVVVPLNPRFKSAETAGLLKQAEICLIITNLQGSDIIPDEFAAARTEHYQVDGVEKTVPEELMVIALHQDKNKKVIKPTVVRRQDEAVLLFTSGSTGVPKGVVLTHGNLLAETENIQKAHHLTSQDIVLCILPFFHANGLIITFFTTAFAGGQVIIPHKFSAGKFWTWANKYQVTWFSAVPTILSILLSSKEREPVPKTLRFARSASASLPMAVFESFEKRFQVPIIESYGMSEAASQITTNPLPPAERKVGSVGLPVGNELRIVDEAGSSVPPGREGEVVIKGAHVTPGYLNNVKANRDSFRNGWFYSGDLGYLDRDGYLFLTGRRKELINRAGEKISPREVDEVLYRLPEVEIAAVVGIPDALFGEEIVAFIQLRPERQISVAKVLDHCREFLVDFKVPKEIIYLDEFPKGPNGKVQRCRLVELYERIKQKVTTK